MVVLLLEGIPTRQNLEIKQTITKELEIIGSVSYTHLDVYKRQTIYIANDTPNYFSKSKIIKLGFIKSLIKIETRSAKCAYWGYDWAKTDG